MPDRNLKKLSTRELKDLITQAETLLAKKAEEEKSRFLADMKKMADERGLDFDELVRPRTSRARVKAAFRSRSVRHHREP